MSIVLEESTPVRTKNLLTPFGGSQGNKLTVFAIAPDKQLSKMLYAALCEVSGLSVAKTFDDYPEGEEFIRAIRAYAPNLLFIDMNALSCADQLIRIAKECISGVQIVAIHRSCSSDVLLEVIRMGVQEFLSLPITVDRVSECCERARTLLAVRPSNISGTDLVYSFLPAKPGAGASTIAVNCAIIAAELSDEKVFLGDFDLNSGVIRFMLRLTGMHSIVDAAKQGHGIDSNHWAHIIQSRGNLDIVHAGDIDLETRIMPEEARYVIEFVRRSYKMICADLSGNLEKFSLEIMRESKKIFLATTPELPVMHLAREKVKFLDSIGLSDRVAVVLNRFPKRHPITIPEIEKLIGVPVIATLPNDYAHLHEAIGKGTGVSGKSELGMQMRQLAQSMLSMEPSYAQPQKKKFMEYFYVRPMRYTLGSR